MRVGTMIGLLAKSNIHGRGYYYSKSDAAITIIIRLLVKSSGPTLSGEC